ncbi:MAG: trehalose-6-phosphate synthase, partial [Actinobacteria bacterium]|nr:trehalose-6-phosphate synthase [Actinomycetota bacterium]
VSALGAAMRERDAVWVAAALSDADREATKVARGVIERDGFRINLLDIESHTYDLYYNTIANRFLWFVCHYLWEPSRAPSVGPAEREAWSSYEAVNRHFAEVVAAETAQGAPAMLQDYHLALAPKFLRAGRPDLRIGLFWHIPFPEPDYFRLLPDAWTGSLLEGMLGADVLGFQSKRWARNFVECVREVLGAKATRSVEHGGRLSRIGIYPVGVDPEHLATSAADPAVKRERAHISSWLGDKCLLLRVDRTELSKNILRGFRAYELLLERRPDLHGTMTHLALLTPSRRDVPEYREYIDECETAAKRINERFGGPGWEPLRIEIEDNFPRTLAAYVLYDVLIVNPVFDGMNLVAREGPTLNRHHGMLVLSRNAGAWEELHAAALGVNPFDVEGTSAAIETALEMSGDERKARAAKLRRLARGRPPSRWLERQIRDLPPA